MRILLVNDDGIEGVGLIAMVKELYGKHDITVVAPKHECSGNSHALNFRTPIVVTKTTIPGYEDVPAWHVDGSPADCTRIALKVIMKDNLPDIVLSGINRGPNMGVNILWSGTTNAATQQRCTEFVLWHLAMFASPMNRKVSYMLHSLPVD